MLSCFLLLIFIFIMFYILNRYLNFIENYQNLSTQAFFDEAEKNNFIVDKDNKIIMKYDDNNNLIKKSYKYHFNTIESVRLVKDKAKTSVLLYDNNIPVPMHLLIDINEDIGIIYNQMKEKNISFPIVIKPIDGTFGIDVNCNINNLDEIRNVLNIFRKSKKSKKYKNMMLEEQIDGHVYRIFVFNGEVIDIIKREKPFVIGNNKNTILELIEERNKKQIENNFFKTTINESYLKKQGHSLEDIPEDNKKILITDVINMHNGALVERIDLIDIPKDNIDMFKNVNKVIGINCSGIDFLSNDISVPYNLNNSRILEINGTPDSSIHTISLNKPLNFFKTVVSNIFNT